MPTIVAASDLTPRSDPALARAMALAAARGAALRAVTVLPEGDGSDDSAESAAAALRAALARLPGAARTDWTVETLRGDPAAAVAEAARAAEAELLVLGLHRPRPFDALRQTTMERILALAPCPVLLARDPPAGPHARVLALTAFSPACAAAVRAARTLAPGAELRLLHALRVPLADLLAPERAEAAAAEAARAWAAALPPDLPAPLIVEGDLHGLLAVALEDERPDLLALGASTGPEPGALGHYVRDLIRDPPCDVLVARD